VSSGSLNLIPKQNFSQTVKLAGKISSLLKGTGMQSQCDTMGSTGTAKKSNLQISSESGVAEVGMHVNLINNNLSLPLAQARFMSQANSKKEFKVSFSNINPTIEKRVSSAKNSKSSIETNLKSKKSSDMQLMSADAMAPLPVHIQVDLN